MRWLPLLVLAAVTAPLPAQAEVVRHRLLLPPPGAALDLALVAPEGVDPVRIVLSGTVTSSIDGVEYDPVAGRRFDGSGPRGEGPFVAFPPGARLVEKRGAGRTVVELPRAASMPLSLQVAPLARRHLVTMSEASASLSGGVEVQVLGPAPAVPEVAFASLAKELAEVPTQAAAPVAGGASLLGLLGVLGFVQLRRTRRRRRLMRRIRSTARGIGAESRALGPAFDHVTASSEALLHAAGTAQRHLQEARAALRRTRRHSSAAAALERQGLRQQEAEALGRLESIAERLEATRVALAAHGAGRSADACLSDSLEALDLEMATALSAEAEAGALS